MTRAGRWIAAAGASALLGACSFGFPDGATEQGRDMANLYRTFFWFAIPVAGVVYALIGWSLLRHRRRREDPEDARGAAFSENVPLEIAYTAIPIVIVSILFVLAFRTEDRVGALDPNPDVVVHADAFAWGWRFTYEGEDVTVVSAPNDSDVPDRGPALVLPLDRTTEIRLTSSDTIHAFWVPDFAYKHDAIPGRTFRFDLTPDELGDFAGHCAEFCGLNHAYMNFNVQVVHPDEFASWLDEQRGEAA